MRCEQARRMLSGKAARDLDAHEEKALEDHLAGCAACSTLGEELEQTWSALAHAPSIEVSPGFLPRLKARLRAGDAEVPPLSHRHFAWRWQWVALAACAVLVAVILTKTTPREDHPPVVHEGITSGTDRDHRDELFLQDLEQTLRNSASDYLATYDSWPGGAQEPKTLEPAKARSTGKMGKKEPS